MSELGIATASAEASGSVISSHVAACLKLFEGLHNLACDSESIPAGEIERSVVLDERGRFCVWAGNIGANNKGCSSLDYRLRDASHIKRQAQQLLSDLNDSIKDGKKPLLCFCAEFTLTYSEAIEILGERTPWDKLSPRPASDSGSDTTDGDSDDGIPEGETEINQVMESIHDTITQLLRFSTAIKNPAPHDQHMNSAEIDTSCFESFDIDHVRNKYPDAPEDLAVTLGKAISSRRGYFKYREAHSKKLAHGTISELAPSYLPPTSGSDMITTDYVRDETLPQSTIASSLPLEVKESNIFIDLDQDQQSDSGMTQTSFASSAVSFHELKVPPMPKEARDGEPFPCPFCFMMISISARRSWK